MAQDEEKCPVDHATREAWLAQAKKANPNASHPPTSTSTSTSPSTATPSTPTQALSTPGCDSSTLNQSLAPPHPGALDPLRRLGTDREISTIPRALPSGASARPPPNSPANAERDTGADKASGNWIYPSEQMFFDAMKRKSFSPSAPDMRTIVPIHNAVNERAWAHIKDWEAPYASAACGGPRLASFSGLASAMTPRARWNTWMGYRAPFDRHDWVVDRCGTRVEYVIDFYAGKEGGGEGKELSFYLDVRPKLNTWEGVKMRAWKFVGL